MKLRVRLRLRVRARVCALIQDFQKKMARAFAEGAFCSIIRTTNINNMGYGS